MLDERKMRLGILAGFFIFFGLGTIGGLQQALKEQPGLKWIYIGLALLAFVSGFMVGKLQTYYLHRDWEIEASGEEKRMGRPLLEPEIQEVKARFKEKRQRGETNVRFPLQRLVVRLLLLLPAIVAISFLVAIGAFISGVCLVAFVEDSQKRTLADF